jgi:hypothetical protein
MLWILALAALIVLLIRPDEVWWGIAPKCFASNIHTCEWLSWCGMFDGPVLGRILAALAPTCGLCASVLSRMTL